MRPSFEAVQSPANSSFLVRQFEEKEFSAPYHFHPEYELTLILKGEGKRYVGSHMNDFFPGDLVLLGTNLPHCWKTDAGLSSLSRSIVIHFKKDFLGEDFLHKPEMQVLKQLLDRSSHGIQFKGHIKALQENMVQVLQEPDAFKKILFFLELLHSLSYKEDILLLDKKNTYAAFSAEKQKRMHAVMAYIVDNFQSTISVAAAAATAHMSVPAFCKYFKKITRKTFIESVTDYRLDFAVIQLINTENSIVRIGFSSGFGDISNFHKIFKRRMGMSPLAYRKKFTASVN